MRRTDLLALGPTEDNSAVVDVGGNSGTERLSKESSMDRSITARTWFSGARTRQKTVQVKKLSARMRYLDVRHLWLRELETRGIIDIEHIPTEDNTADYFTKILTKTSSLKHLGNLITSK